jgi:hypothetical protein
MIAKSFTPHRAMPPSRAFPGGGVAQTRNLRMVRVADGWRVGQPRNQVALHQQRRGQFWYTRETPVFSGQHVAGEFHDRDQFGPNTAENWPRSWNQPAARPENMPGTTSEGGLQLGYTTAVMPATLGVQLRQTAQSGQVLNGPRDMRAVAHDERKGGSG